MPLVELLAEVLGRSGGTNGGRAGSLLISSPQHRFFGENGIVGGHLPIAVGVGLAFSYNTRRGAQARVSVAVFGDGATNQGMFHEAVNMASVFDWPVVFVCENNLYSELTPIADMVNVERLTDRALAYGVPGILIDGNAVAQVSSAMRAALDRARSGGGPTFLELMTYRLEGHYVGDPGGYRPDLEVEQAWQNEPIRRFQLAEGVTDEVISILETEVRAAVDEAWQDALAQPKPDPRTVGDHVYGA